MEHNYSQRHIQGGGNSSGFHVPFQVVHVEPKVDQEVVQNSVEATENAVKSSDEFEKEGQDC